MNIESIQVLSDDRNFPKLICPSWHEIEREIRSLDGDEKVALDLMFTSSSKINYVAVNGGENNNYFVSVLFRNGISFVCAAGQANAADKLVASCQDYARCPSSWVINIETVVDAVKELCFQELMSRRLNWERIQKCQDDLL